MTCGPEAVLDRDQALRPALDQLADRLRVIRCMLEELLQVAHQMWNGDETPFAGRHYQLMRPLNSPNLVQRPRPPILIAGGGEQKTLRFVARYGDACHLPDLPGTPYEVDLKHKLDVLRQHCDDAGRDYARIEKTIDIRPGFTDDAVADASALLTRLRALSALGFDHAMLAPSGPWTEARIDVVASILPEVHGLAR